MSDSYIAHARAPKQLDIIADTALCAETKTPCELSTATKTQTPCELSTATKDGSPRELSTAGIKAIEGRRLKAGIKLTKLCVLAGVHTRTYEDARAGKARIRPSTLEKLTRALDTFTAASERGYRRTSLQSYLRRLVRDFARQQGLDPDLLVNQDFSSECTNDPIWLQASRLRRFAIYVLVEGLLDGQRAPIARAAGISRQAVHKGVAAVESERMRDEAIDQWMEREIQDVRADR